MPIALLQKTCVPCEGGTAPFSPEKIQEYMALLDKPWEVVENKKIRKTFRFSNYQKTIDFVNRVAALAESEGHHPDMHVYWGRVVIELWTHAIGGLSENDFILAAKIDANV